MALTTVQPGMLGATQPYNFKNRIINGAMLINQRGFSGAITNTSATTYTLDRWYAYGTQASKFTVAQSSTAPTGFINSLLATSSSAYTVGSGELFIIGQSVEGFNISDLGWGTANAKTVTLSFQVYSSLTGTFGGSVLNGGQSRSYPFTYTVSSANTWTTISLTIPGDTAGTWATDNTTGLKIYWGLGVGSTYSGTAGSWASASYFSATGATSVVGTNGATFYITGVQLELGVSATSFDYRPYGTELALCQRYLPSVITPNYYSGVSTTTTNGYAPIPLPVTARIAPTGVTLASGTYYWLNGSGSQIVTASVIFNSAGTQTAMLQITTAGSLTAGQAGLFNPNGASILFTGSEL